MSGPVPLSLAEVEARAEALLPPDRRDFVAGGSGDEATQRANRAELDRIALVPRVLAGLSDVDTSARLVASDAALPVAVAPMAYQRLLHPDGELAVAKAAHDAGVPFTVGTLSSHRVEDVAAVGGTAWFQLYWLRDRERTVRIVRRAEDAGCTALMVTVDVPVMGRRLRDIRNAFTLPAGITAPHLADTTTLAHRTAAGSAVAAHTRAVVEPALSWADLDRLREVTGLPLVLKGILHPADAARAAGAGVDAIVVSNHGGRQLAGAVPAVTALPAVAAAVAGRCQVLFDSGIRSGTDVLRALALGADGVLLGRPVLWGLAWDGAAGVSHVLELLRAELHDALLLAGCADVAAAKHLDTVRLGNPRDAGA
jgi:4-hydroxymandelate oxidase